MMGRSFRFVLGALLPILCVGVFESRADAQELGPASPRAYDAPFRLKLHAVVPFAQFTLANPGHASGRSIGVTLAGASVEAEFNRLWAVEVGGNFVTWIDADFPRNFDVFARGGLVPVVYDGRNSNGLGWTIQFDALAGYRWLKRHQSPDGHPGTESTHAVRGNLGFDFTRQFSRVGFVARVLSGVTLPLAQTRTGNWASHSYISPNEDLKWALDLGVDVGIAL